MTILFQKEALNFALYSSNWTNQCIHFKKLLFLAMNMNSAENLNMKVSFRKVFNLELFAGVCKLYFYCIICSCYSDYFTLVYIFNYE